MRDRRSNAAEGAKTKPSVSKKENEAFQDKKKKQKKKNLIPHLQQQVSLVEVWVAKVGEAEEEVELGSLMKE